MKKKWFLIALIILLIIAIVLILCLTLKKEYLNCAIAGEVSKNPSAGPNNIINKQCCNGLVEIPGGLSYAPDHKYADENGCDMISGGGIICSDCGNNNCEAWEDPCNCPVDCSA